MPNGSYFQIRRYAVPDDRWVAVEPPIEASGFTIANEGSSSVLCRTGEVDGDTYKIIVAGAQYSVHCVVATFLTEDPVCWLKSNNGTIAVVVSFVR